MELLLENFFDVEIMRQSLPLPFGLIKTSVWPVPSVDTGHFRPLSL